MKQYSDAQLADAARVYRHKHDITMAAAMHYVLQSYARAQELEHLMQQPPPPEKPKDPSTKPGLRQKPEQPEPLPPPSVSEHFAKELKTVQKTMDPSTPKPSD